MGFIRLIYEFMMVTLCCTESMRHDGLVNTKICKIGVYHFSIFLVSLREEFNIREVSLGVTFC